jgi:hypothetical protein
LPSEREWKDPDDLSSAHAAAGSSLDNVSRSLFPPLYVSSCLLLLYFDASCWIGENPIFTTETRASVVRFCVAIFGNLFLISVIRVNQW